MVRLRRAPPFGLFTLAGAGRLRGGARGRAGAPTGSELSVDVSTWTLVDDAFRARVREVAPNVVFATEREQEVLGSVETRWVVKRGAAGLRVDGADYPAVETDAVDTTGAGDALAAGFLVGGPQLGLEAAARCCAQLGSMP